MSDNRDKRLMIVPCDYVYGCASFVCNDISEKYYHVGNPYSGALNSYDAYCEDCIRHMIATIPAELSPSTADIENRLRLQLTAEYNELLATKIADHEDAVRDQADKYIAQRLADAQSPFGDVPLEVEEAQEATDEAHVFRCLDCNDDFNTLEELNAHKDDHPAPKNKGGRPKKAETK